MNILVSGSTGLVGSHFVERRSTRNEDDIYRLVRDPADTGERRIYASPADREVDAKRLEGFDAVIHLAGEPINGRWNERKKKKIRDSRIEGTRLLSEALADRSDPPETFLCASAIGYYGDRGDEKLDETSGPGNLFLSRVCRGWEEACEPAAEAGIRVVNMRFGMILSSEGGALSQMLLPFQLGLGGPIGDGRMWMSWVDIDDVVRVMTFLLDEATDLSGPVNVTAPSPVRNQTFTDALADVLARPTFFPIPKFGLRFLYGEMADNLLFPSARVYPRKLRDAGFSFDQAQIRTSLLNQLQTRRTKRA